ncbi:MAG: sel1 repeat family protein [Clostridia bacterium]|nr:sel1 repeat family protein [Clostridia bacterium]
MSLSATNIPVGLFVSIFMIGFGIMVAIAITVYVLKAVRRSNYTGQGAQITPNNQNQNLYDNLSAEELYTLALGHINKTVKNSDYFLGKELMKKAAIKGNAQAQFYYADKFCYNDNALAVEFFEKAAAQGMDEAAKELGDIYNYGREDGEPVIEENPELALKYYLPLAEKGDVEVQKLVALIYSLKYDDEENEFKWNLKAAETGDLEAIEEVVDYYDMNGDIDNAVLWCKKFIDANGEEALFRMGRIYEFAEPADYDKAVYWYRRAADAGDEDAEVKLGILYLEGNGLIKNELKAVEIFREKSENGNKWATLKLAECYHDGNGVSRDYKKAFELFSSVEETYSSAKYSLALMYLDGNGVEKDAEKAYGLLCEADKNFPDDEITYKLGELLFFGTGCKSDKPRARELWRDAANDGNEDAIAALDKYFGEVIKPDED